MQSEWDTPPCIIIIGLSGTGKSSCAEWIEKHFRACRVRRFTTRAKRCDDDPVSVVNVCSAETDPDDFVYYGWNNTTYWIRGVDIANIREKQQSPVVELGDPNDALGFRRAFAPAKIVCLWRQTNTESMRLLFSERKMQSEDIRERILSLEGDLKNLEEKSGEFDFCIYNNGSLVELFEQWRLVLSKMGVGEFTR